MGIDCGFDVYPALEPSASNREKHDMFLRDVLAKYKEGSEIEKRELCVEFMIGEHPEIPYSCEDFLRFSSKISGRSTAEPYIDGVYKIAKKWLGDRVHYWHELNEFADIHSQYGYYGWDKVHEARRKMEQKKEQEKEREQGQKRSQGLGTERVNKISEGTMGEDRLFAVRPLPGKGQGLIAKSKIPKGTRILSEAPLFKVPRDINGVAAMNGVIIDKLKTISKEQQRAFLSLHNAHGDRYGPFLGIVKTNALPLGSDAVEGGLFLEASRINHSCRHNSQNTWNDNLDQITIHNFRDLEEGEEITISYLDGSQSFAARQQSLKLSFGFECTCDLCSLSLDQRRASDRNLDEITRLDNVIGDGMQIVSAPLGCLHNAHKLYRLLQEEQVADARVSRLYYDALQIVIAHGDEARAKVFAERAYDARVILEGEDSPETVRLKALVDRPARHRLYGTSMRWKQALKKVPLGLGQDEFEQWLWMMGKFKKGTK